MNIISERNLFINTSSVPVGNGRDVSINLPQGYADCAFGEQMRMTLSTFLMEKKFYDVNETNNIFFLVAVKEGGTTLADIISKPIVIQSGNYKSFGGQQTYGTGEATPNDTAKWYNNRGIGYQLVTQIEKALGVTWDESNSRYDRNADGIYPGTGNTASTARNIVTVTHGSVSGQWTIVIDATVLVASPVAINYNFKLFSFELSQGANNTIVQTITNGKGIFVDTHELLGGCSVSKINNLQEPAAFSDINLLTQMFTPSAESNNKGTYTGHFQASLKTLEAVYVRTNLSSSNYQTASFDSGNDLYPFVISSDILAKIPIYTSTVATSSETNYPLYSKSDPIQTLNVQYGYNDETFPAEYISFIDQGGHTFSMMLNTNHVSQIRMFLTDDKGRLIPWESNGQETCNEMYFTATLKVTITKPL